MFYSPKASYSFFPKNSIIKHFYAKNFDTFNSTGLSWRRLTVEVLRKNVSSLITSIEFL